jgi:hypothetical protein
VEFEIGWGVGLERAFVPLQTTTPPFSSVDKKVSSFNAGFRVHKCELNDLSRSFPSWSIDVENLRKPPPAPCCNIQSWRNFCVLIATKGVKRVVLGSCPQVPNQHMAFFLAFNTMAAQADFQEFTSGPNLFFPLVFDHSAGQRARSNRH